MQRLLFSALGMLGLALLPLGMGCSDKKPTNNNPPATNIHAASNVPKEDGSKSGGAKTAATPIAPGEGVITGKVTFTGTEPKKEILAAIAKFDMGQKPELCCTTPKGVDDPDNRDQTWIIGKDKGVANVVVFLKAPKGKYFAVSDADKKRTSKVIIDQPHCAFDPHVAAVFAYYKSDGKKLEKTGETLEVKNSAAFPHNTKTMIDGNPAGSTIASMAVLTPPLDLAPDSKPYKLECNVHSFMQAKVWSFDNPYFAVTKDDGTFEIKGVPTDVPLDFVAWHEGSSAANNFFATQAITAKKGAPLTINLDLK